MVKETRTGSMPWGVSVHPSGKHVYVTHVGLRDRDNVWRYDAATLEVKARSQFEGHAVESVVTRDGKILYVSNSRVDHFLALDPMTLEVKRIYRTDSYPKDFRLSPDESWAIVANWRGSSADFIDLESGEVDNVPTGRHARGAEVAPDGKSVWITNFSAGTVSLLDASRKEEVREARACRNARHMAVTEDGKDLLVTCFGESHVLVMDPRTLDIRKKIRVGRAPKTVLITRDGRYALTANEKGHSVTWIDLDSWETREISVPARKPIGLAESPDGKRIYVTARGSHELLVFEREAK